MPGSEPGCRITHIKMTTDPPAAPPPDEGLRRKLKWAFVVLILTVLFAVLVVEFTLRWFDRYRVKPREGSI